MSEVQIFEGKTTNEAIEKGLKELRVSRNDIEIKVLENEDKRSFFSILTPRIVKVEMRLKEGAKRGEVQKEVTRAPRETRREVSKEVLEKANKNITSFLDNWLKTLPSKDLGYEINLREGDIRMEIKGEDINYLIGYRGEVLNACQTLFSSIASKGLDERVRVIIDIYGYRGKREKVLEELAEKIAKTVVRKGKSIALEPMSSYERKIIHSKLQDHPNVTTSSAGEEPYRKIIVSLK